MAEIQDNQPAAAPASSERSSAGSANVQDGNSNDNRSETQENKRKRGGHNKPLQHGSRNQRRDVGRTQYHKHFQVDRRGRNEIEQTKRRKLEDEAPGSTSGGRENLYPAPFSAEEIAAEERRPKRKVAVLIGYSGTGYKGMQIMPNGRTIEGDLFNAFVAAGAISKANANDPKKNGLVRCARTDKGVHAAGNVVSLKLIVEDEDVVEKINANLSPQIRIWGIERTTGSFSCYQACDSRWYEYMLPSHTLLPPHPKSFLGKKLVEFAKEEGDLERYNSRQEEVKNFWADVEAKHIQPILAGLDDEIKKKVLEAMYDVEDEPEIAEHSPQQDSVPQVTAAGIWSPENVGTATDPTVSNTTASIVAKEADSVNTKSSLNPLVDQKTRALREATKALKAAYLHARNTYRVSPARLSQLQEALTCYEGTNNFHNFTIRKPAKDPSAKRHIKSFIVNPEPIVKNGIEWLSLKVHGQSFMMHQIRKMVGLAALVVRTGCPISRIPETFGDSVISIPKAPSLGLLLERPVFDSYNTNQAPKSERAPIDFGKYEKEMLEFKDREIYDRMFKVEEEEGVYSSFFAHLDGYKEIHFLYLTSKGLKAAGDGRKARTVRGMKSFDGESDDEKAGGEDG